MKTLQHPQSKKAIGDQRLPPVESTYSFEELVDNGAVIKVTSWASRQMGFTGGRLRVDVAVTVRLWRVLHKIPPELTFFQTVRGRGHDVLWLAGWALRRARRHGIDQVKYLAALPTSEDDDDAKLLCAQCGATESGRPYALIGLAEEFPLAVR